MNQNLGGGIVSYIIRWLSFFAACVNALYELYYEETFNIKGADQPACSAQSDQHLSWLLESIISALLKTVISVAESTKLQTPVDQLPHGMLICSAFCLKPVIFQEAII